MSSTDREALLRSFFSDRLLPAAEALKRRRAPLLEPGPDPSAATYWHDRGDPGHGLTALDFDHLDEALETLWRDAGLPELASLAGELVELARAVQEERQEADVDPYIYQMF